MNVLAHHWPLGTEVSVALFSLWNSHTVIQCPIKMALVSSGAPLLWGPPAADTLILSILPSLIRLRVEMPGTPPSSLLPPSLCFFLHLLSLGSRFFPLPSLEEEQLSPLGSCAHFQFFFFFFNSLCRKLCFAADQPLKTFCTHSLQKCQIFKRSLQLSPSLSTLSSTSVHESLVLTQFAFPVSSQNGQTRPVNGY